MHEAAKDRGAGFKLVSRLDIDTRVFRHEDLDATGPVEKAADLALAQAVAGEKVDAGECGPSAQEDGEDHVVVFVGFDPVGWPSVVPPSRAIRTSPKTSL